MKVKVVLKAADYENVNIIDDIIDLKHIEYLDENTKCKIDIYDDSITVVRENDDYHLEMSLGSKSITRLRNEFGEIEIDTKTLAFIKNNDILLVRYLIEIEEREIRIEFLGENE